MKDFKDFVVETTDIREQTLEKSIHEMTEYLQSIKGQSNSVRLGKMVAAAMNHCMEYFESQLELYHMWLSKQFPDR